MEELQAIVDMLAGRLGRSVAVDDPSLRLRCYSAHHGTVDKVRMTSILTRSVPRDVSRWAFSQGIKAATEPLRVSGNPAFGLDPRVCIPIRHDGVLLGYLWLIDADGTLNDDAMAEAKASAEAAADVMYRERLLDHLKLGRERELVRDLVSESAEIRDAAAVTLVESDLIAQATAYVAIVVRATGVSHADSRITSSIGNALDSVRARYSRRHVIPLARPGRGLVVMAQIDASPRQRSALKLAEEARTAVQRELDRGPGGGALVGVGEWRMALADLRASYNEALFATRVAEVVSSFAPVAEWAQLGIYRMLLKFPAQEITRDALPPGLLQIMGHADREVMLRTLEVYLDRAGNAPATAAALNLHRVSLYGRIRRIEEVAGIDLGDGQERLALHLGLKLARLAGLTA
ncbi:MAG: PucR family transcriptional regulator [Candidatus Dormibacteria bacterium]